MKDLKKPYQQKLSYLEAAPDFIDNVHVTRLKFQDYLNKENRKFSAFLLLVKMDEHCSRL